LKIFKVLDKNYPKPEISMEVRPGLQFVRMQPKSKKLDNRTIKIKKILNDFMHGLHILKIKNVIRVLVEGWWFQT
jgi:hypothetical protein